MISDVRLQNFRSYKDGSFEFENGVNIVVGPNASGKTNLLESIIVLCRGRSYKSPDNELVRFGQDWATLKSHHNNIERIVKWQTQGSQLNKSITVGGTTLKRLSLQKTIPVVLFEPNHMQLLTGAPIRRRDFIDDTLEQLLPDFGHLRRSYRRALAQRNSLLKTSFTSDQIFVWDVRISELGSQVVAARTGFINTNQRRLQIIHNKLSGKSDKVSLGYKSNLSTNASASKLLKALQTQTNTDKQRGFTSVGPHRDDVMPILNSHEIVQAGSRGETRTMLLTLKLLELEAIEQARGTKPLLLLDDVFSELDGKRRKALTAYLKNHQTFITTTDADIVTKNFTKTTNLIAL